MISIAELVTLTHVLGLALGVGAATVKLVIVSMCRSDQAMVSIFLKIARPITRVIILGLILLTLSGIAWLFIGVSFTPILIVKSALVLLLWGLGPYIDNVVEPALVKLAPTSGELASPAFLRAQNRYLAFEGVATALFYAITVMGVLLQAPSS